jgi:hypothetical protein
VKGVRSFVEGDIPQVAHLHQRVFRPGESVDLAAYQEYLTRTFLANPAGEGPVSSLVYQEGDGRIVGFIGLVPRILCANGRRCQALVSSQFIVDPASRAGVVALQLAKTYLEGPQDVSIADEANDVSRKLWEGLGGTTALLYSIYWTRPLRPARLAMSFLQQRRGLAPIATAVAPIAAIADVLATRFPGSHFRQTAPAVTAGELCGDTVAAQMPAMCGPTSFRMEYNGRTFQSLLDRAARRGDAGRLLKATVTSGDKLLGWYICYIDHSGVGDVAQLAATPSSIDQVLDRLIHDAWRQGAVALTGRLEPRFMQALSDKYCLFHRRGPWVLIKTRNPDLLEAFQTGNAGFSRFDGEWALRFPGSKPAGRA